MIKKYPKTRFSLFQKLNPISSFQIFYDKTFNKRFLFILCFLKNIQFFGWIGKF